MTCDYIDGAGIKQILSLYDELSNNGFKCILFEDNEESQCLVINTTEELLNNYIGIDSFPDIDFNRYTLVVGQEIMPESYYTILRQELRPIGDEFILYIYVPELDGWFCSVQHLFYWGIYPKMQSPKITVEIIKERL